MCGLSANISCRTYQLAIVFDTLNSDFTPAVIADALVELCVLKNEIIFQNTTYKRNIKKSILLMSFLHCVTSVKH